MSLMNYGFTKSKVDRKNESQVPDIERQEAEMVSCVKSSQGKPLSKLPPKPVGKPDKVKKENKSTPTKPVAPVFPCKKASPEKVNKKATPKKTSPQGTSKMKSPKDPLTKSPQNTVPKIKAQDNSPVNRKLPSDPTGISLPYQRIKMIMKSCPDVEIVPQESLHVITKATELFIQYLVVESLKFHKTSELDYESLSELVHSDGSLEFLKETIPKKITWAECQKLIIANEGKRDDWV